MLHLERLLPLALGSGGLALLYSFTLLVTGQETFSLTRAGWEAAGIFVMGCALYFSTSRSRAHGWRLLAAIFVFAAGVNALLVTFEMLVFTDTQDVWSLVLWWILRAAGLSLLLTSILGRWQPRCDVEADSVPPRYSPAGWIWRVAVSVLCYTVLFMVAGLLIMQLQAVPDYTSPEYSAKTTADVAEADSYTQQPDAETSSVKVPEPQVVFGFIWTRGLACILFALPLLRGLSGGRWTAGLSIGIALAVLGGVAPLLAPNADMTTGARFGHMLEIGWSNFAYGLVIGFFFGNRAPVGRAPAA